MPSSLHISLPDEMRAFVDLRTNGEQDFSTPSEYVRALIRADMEDSALTAFVRRELLKSEDDVVNGRVLDAKTAIARVKSKFTKPRAA